ncbi:thermonuclease family protein, partial [Aurantiacibacter luteus]
LERIVTGQPLTIVRVGLDRYGRTLGVVYAGEVNTSCAMLSAGQAEYVRRWDNGGAVRRDCSELAK